MKAAARTPSAGHGGQAVAGTIPPHAKSGAVKSHSLADATPAAKARAGRKAPRPMAAPSRRPRPAALPPPPDYAALAMQQLAPQFMGLNQEQQRYERAAADRNAAIQGFTQAMIAELKGEPAAVASQYDQDIARSQALSQASAQALSAANPNAKVQADLAAIGAPAAQQTQVQNALGQTFTGGAAVLGHVGGTIPEQTMLANKDAQVGYLSTLPSVASATGFRELNRALLDRSIVEQQFRGRRQQMEAQVPSLIQQLQATAQENALKQQALAVNQQIARATLGVKGATAAASIASSRARTAQGGQRIKLQGVALQERQLQNDRQWQATLRRLGIQEAGLRLRASQIEAKRRASAANGGFTKSQRIQLNKRAGQIADRAFNGTPTTQTGPDGKPVHGTIHYSYQEAIRQMLAEGIPLVVAQRALDSFWTQPGAHQAWETPGQGRPLRSYQQRQATRRRPR